MQIDMLDRQGPSCLKLIVDEKDKLLISVFEDWTLYVQRKDFYKKDIIRELKNPCGIVNRPTNMAASFHLNLIAFS